MGPDVKASLVIYFKTGVNDDDINQFVRAVLSKRDPEGRGYYNRDGVRDILKVYPAVQGHEAYAVTFFPDATQEKQDDLKAAVNTSPIVYKVLENVAPADVKRID